MIYDLAKKHKGTSKNSLSAIFRGCRRVVSRYNIATYDIAFSELPRKTEVFRGSYKEFGIWIGRNLEFVRKGITSFVEHGDNEFEDIIQNAKSNAKTVDDLKLYTVEMKDGSTRVFSKSEIKANPKIQQMLVAQLKSQGRWPQKQAASA